MIWGAKKPEKPKRPLPPEVLADLARSDAVVRRLRKVVDDTAEDFRKLRADHVLGHVLETLHENTSAGVNETDEFAAEVQREDRLLKEQEGRWAAEDKRRGMK